MLYFLNVLLVISFLPKILANTIIDSEEINNPLLALIKQENQKFIDDPQYVYKLCQDKWFMILKINQFTKTDDDNDPKKRMFTASELDVIKIIDVNDGSTIESLERISCDLIKLSVITYSVGKTTEPDPSDVKYNKKDKIYLTMIYFKTVDQAFFFQRYVPEFYTGTWKLYDAYDGYLDSVNNYKDGLLHGKSTIYREDNIIDESMYENGILNGISRHYYDNGKLSRYSTYKNGNKIGVSLTFYHDGRLWLLSDDSGLDIDNTREIFKHYENCTP